MSEYLEIISVDESGDGRKTGLTYSGKDVRQLFEQLRRFHVHGRSGWDFMIDLHDKDGCIEEWIHFKREDFETITGRKPLTHDEYREYDKTYWQMVGTSLDQCEFWLKPTGETCLES